MKYMSLHWKKLLASFLIGSATLGVAVTGAAESPFQITSNVKGYVTKTDPTNLPPEYLVSGSQNVIINDQEKVESRAGYELFGVASTTATAITSDFVWRNSGATSTSPSEILLRASGSVLQFYATSTFQDLSEQVSTDSPIRFSTVWSSTEQMDVLLFVNASSTLFEWSGGQATLASTTSTSIGINETIGENRFFLSGTRQLRLKDTSGTWQTFTYTGVGGAVSTFTGVTPDPTSFTFGTGASVVQAVRSNLNTPASGFVSDTIKVLNNQIWIGSKNSRQVFVSKDTSYTSFTFSSPRIAGEGALLTLDDTTIGFESPDDNKMLVFSGKDRVYQVSFEVSPSSTGNVEVPRVKPLLISAGQGAQSQELIGKIKQAVVWVSNNNELVELGQVENLPSSQAVAISDPIKPDFTAATFTNGDIEFWKNSIFISAPADGKVYIFDVAKRFWQAPQVLGVRRFSIFGNALYGHSNSVPETYKLFTGVNDNSNPISFKAHFSYRNGTRRDIMKNFDKFFTELYIAGNTKVTVSLLYEWKGAKQITEYDLDGAVTDFLFTPNASAALGVNPLGTNPLGGQLVAGENTPKYRRFKQIVPADYFEYQPRFESDSDDGAFQIVAFGANERQSGNLPVKIIK